MGDPSKYNLDRVKRYLNKVDGIKDFKIKMELDKQPSLDSFFEEEEEDIRSSFNILAANYLLDRVEENVRNPEDEDQLAALRDKLAELIGSYRKNVALPTSLSDTLQIYAAIEDEFAGMTPLVRNISEQLDEETFEYASSEERLVLRSVIKFFNRSTYRKGDLDAINQKLDVIREEYLARMQESTEDIPEDPDEEISETISADDLVKFEAMIFVLEIPSILEEFLDHYIGEGEDGQWEELLDSTSDDLSELGNYYFAVLSRRLASIIRRVRDRMVINIDDHEIREYLLNRKMYELWPPQIRAIRRIIDVDKSYFIYQPTSSGKSLLAEIWIHKHLLRRRDEQVIYIVPSKALANQAVRDLSRSLDAVVTNLSGQQVHPFLDVVRRSLSEVLVMTPEKFTMLYQNGYVRTKQPSTIVIDEAHSFLGVDPRDFTNSVSLLKTKLKMDDIPMLGLSAVIDDPRYIETWEPMRFNLVGSTWRSTRLKTFKIDVKKNTITQLDSTSERLEEVAVKTMDPRYKGLKRPEHVRRLVNELTTGGQKKIIVFTNSRNKSEEMANFISELADEVDDVSEITKFIDAELGENVLSRLISRGVAYHHAGLPPKVLERILTEFENGKVNIICATTTLAEGLNTPADIVIIAYPHHYDAVADKNKPFPLQLIKNMFGRAGRANKEGIGQAYIYTKDMEMHRGITPETTLTGQVNVDVSFPVIREFRNANYTEPDLLRFRSSIYSLICEGVLNSENVSTFIDKIDSKRQHQYEDIIRKTVKSFGKLDKLLIKRSPLRATSRGWICYQTGLDPVSFNDFVERLHEMTNEESLHRTVLNRKFSELNQRERLGLINMFFLPDEARLTKRNTVDSKYRPYLLDMWMSSNGSLVETAERYWEIDPDSTITKIATTIFDTFGNTVTWTAWALFKILDSEFKLSYHDSYSLIPFYIRTGKTEPLEAILESLSVTEEMRDRIRELRPAELEGDGDIQGLFDWLVNTVPEKIEGDNLDVMLLKSLRTEGDRNRAFYIAAFDAGWERIASKSLNRIEVDEDVVNTCIDRILYPVEEHADKISSPLDAKIKIAYSVIEEKNEEKRHVYVRMLDELLARYKS